MYSQMYMHVNVTVILGNSSMVVVSSNSASIAPHMWPVRSSHERHHQPVTPVHGRGSGHSRIFVVSYMTITLCPNQTRPGGPRQDSLCWTATIGFPAAFLYSIQHLYTDVPKLHTHFHAHTFSRTCELCRLGPGRELAKEKIRVHNH